jgi:hypothetical protein
MSNPRSASSDTSRSDGADGVGPFDALGSGEVGKGALIEPRKHTRFRATGQPGLRYRNQRPGAIGVAGVFRAVLFLTGLTGLKQDFQESFSNPWGEFAAITAGVGRRILLIPVRNPVHPV